MKHEECHICGQPCYHMNEADIRIGTMTANVPPICEECYLSEDEEVQAEIQRLSKPKTDQPL